MFATFSSQPDFSPQSFMMKNIKKLEGDFKLDSMRVVIGSDNSPSESVRNIRLHEDQKPMERKKSKKVGFADDNVEIQSVNTRRK